MGVAAPPASAAAGKAEGDMQNYMQVLAALQKRLDTMSTKCAAALPAPQPPLLLSAQPAQPYLALPH